MTSFAKLASVAVLSGIAVAHGAMPVQAGPGTVLSVEPLKAITVSVGPKRAVGYFQSESGSCQLTLVLADAYTDGRSLNEPVRLRTVIAGGTSAEINTQAGRSLAFTCGKDAGRMSVTELDHVAFAAPSK